MKQFKIETPGGTEHFEFTDLKYPFAPTDCAAIHKLAEGGAAALPKLNQVLTADDSDMREAAVATLGQLAGRGVDIFACLPGLIANLKGVGTFASQVAELIGTIGDRAMPVLMQYCRDSDKKYYAALYEAIFHVGQAAIGPVLQVLKSGSGCARWVAMESLGEFFKHRTEWVTPELVTAALEGLRDPDDDLAGYAALALCRLQIETERAVAGLIEAYASAIYENQWGILVCLGQMTDRAAPAIPFLHDLMLHDVDFRLREGALRALCLADRANAIETLREYVIHHRDVTDKVLAACISLDLAGVRLLVEFLGSGESYIRLKAATALGEFGSPVYTIYALPALGKALRDEKPGVRIEAINAIRATGENLVRLAKESANDPNLPAFLDQARECAAPVIAELPSMLHEGEDNFRRKIIFGLAAFGEWSVEAIPALIELGRGKKGVLREAAIKALAEINPDHEELMPLFAEWLGAKDHKVRSAAAQALGRAVNHAPLAAELLQKATEDPNASVKRVANASLKKITALLKKKSKGKG